MLGKRKILNDAEIIRLAPAMQVIINHLSKRKNERTAILQSLIQEHIKYKQEPLKILKYMEQERMIDGEKGEYGWVWSIAKQIE
jgi:hypothetical protein